MASKNYTNRNKNSRKRPSQKSSGGAFAWMLITGLLIGLVVFGVYLKGTGLKKIKHQLQQHSITEPVVAQIIATQPTNTPDKLSPETVEKLEKQPDVILSPEAANELEDIPQFDFYTILPDKDVVVPEHEIITRTRKEQANVPVEPVNSTTISQEQPKPTMTYMMQAGSFKNAIDAEKLRANLASMGIESRIERAKVGEVIWHRIKMGPYTQMSSVSAIRTRLRQSGVDVIVTEAGVQ
jgi:cell division protein FtsN